MLKHLDEIVNRSNMATKVERTLTEKIMVLYVYAYSKIQNNNLREVYGSCFLGLRYCRSYSATNEFIKYFKRECKCKEKIIKKVSDYDPYSISYLDILDIIYMFYPTLKNNKIFERYYFLLFNIGKKKHIAISQEQILKFYENNWGIKIINSNENIKNELKLDDYDNVDFDNDFNKIKDKTTISDCNNNENNNILNKLSNEINEIENIYDYEIFENNEFNYDNEDEIFKIENKINNLNYENINLNDNAEIIELNNFVDGNELNNINYENLNLNDNDDLMELKNSNNGDELDNINYENLNSNDNADIRELKNINDNKNLKSCDYLNDCSKENYKNVNARIALYKKFSINLKTKKIKLNNNLEKRENYLMLTNKYKNDKNNTYDNNDKNTKYIQTVSDSSLIDFNIYNSQLNHYKYFFNKQLNDIYIYSNRQFCSDKDTYLYKEITTQKDNNENNKVSTVCDEENIVRDEYYKIKIAVIRKLKKLGSVYSGTLRKILFCSSKRPDVMTWNYILQIMEKESLIKLTIEEKMVKIHLNK